MNKTSKKAVEESMEPTTVDIVRIMFAGMAMQSLIRSKTDSEISYHSSEVDVARISVKYADALLDELGY